MNTYEVHLADSPSATTIDVIRVEAQTERSAFAKAREGHPDKTIRAIIPTSV